MMSDYPSFLNSYNIKPLRHFYYINMYFISVNVLLKNTILTTYKYDYK